MASGVVNYLQIEPMSPEKIAQRTNQVLVAVRCSVKPMPPSLTTKIEGNPIDVCVSCHAEWWAHYPDIVRAEEWYKPEIHDVFFYGHNLEGTLKDWQVEYNKDHRPYGRRYLPGLGELLDRLSILQIKEVKLPEHKVEYAKEIQDILHDIQLILDSLGDSEIAIDADFLRSVIILAQYNLHIWQNESLARQGIDAGENLKLTHGLNGIRNTAKNKIQELVGGRKDYKIDCLAAEFKDWMPSWN